jgi:hypothetical protein
LIGQQQLNLQDYGFVRIPPLIYTQTGNQKAIQKSPNWNLSSKLFEDYSKDEKNQFVGFVSSHK